MLGQEEETVLIQQAKASVWAANWKLQKRSHRMWLAMVVGLSRTRIQVNNTKQVTGKITDDCFITDGFFSIQFLIFLLEK
jgi:hypothetical protein